MADLRCGVLALLLGLGVQATAGTAEVTGQWRFSTPLGAVDGWYLLLSDETAESWRLELQTAETATGRRDDDLLHRRGRGWTFCGGPGGAFVQTWGEAWRQVGPQTAAFLAELAGLPALKARGRLDDRRRLVLATWAELPTTWQPPRRVFGHRGALRRRMIERGLGGGGDGLIITARPGADTVILTSTRWPVSVALTEAVIAEDRWTLPAEAFLPLWPLADILH